MDNDDLARLEHRLAVLQATLDIHVRETRTLMRQLTLPPQALWRWIPGEMAPSQAWVFPASTGCREEHFRQPYFAYWTGRMQDTLRYHRKLWEFVFICQAAYERGLLAPGRKGLGFGVGGEPLPALFAAEGCEVLATDMGAQEAADAGWAQSAQHAADKAALARPGVCDQAVFDARVTYRNVDMNAVPDDIVGHDFCWSACALEHLGSIEAGGAFIERSMDCLAPGGFAIHTTEFNLSSNDETIDDGPTVLFRRRDLEAIAARLTARGYEVAPLDFNPGYGAIDNYIDVPPYLNEPVLKLALGGYACTSFGMIVRKPA